MAKLIVVVLVALAWPAAASAATRSYTDADYLAFADRVVARLDPTWDPAVGFYRTGAGGVDSRYNAALLEVHAVAAAAGHTGPSRNDARARRLAARLTESPPFSTATTPPYADPMFHTPGWVGAMTGGYDVMDKAIDPKIAQGLEAAWSARDALRLPAAVTARIADEISRVAHTPFFRYPSVRLNQINWPSELYAYEATVTGTPELLVGDYRSQMHRFAQGIRHPWARTGSTTLSPSLRFHYQVNERAGARRNVDSAEYANMTLQFLSFYDQALAAGMAPLPSSDVKILRAWVSRDLFGYWTHSGFMSWDSGLGYRRWMKGKTWAFALQGLLTIARTSVFAGDPRLRPWAKEIFDRALDFYGRRPPAVDGLPGSALFGVDPLSLSKPDARLLAARMAATAANAVTAGLGRMAGAVPPPFYAYDPDVGRLVVSTPAYSAAVVVVNRAAFPYGGIDLARLFDGTGEPIGTVGSRPPAAFGVQVEDRRGRVVATTGTGRHGTPRRPPLTVRLRRGRVAPPPVRGIRAFAGTFGRLDAAGHQIGRDVAITSRHRFGPHAITESWTVRRRSGHRRLTVRVRFPSWGTGAAVQALLRDGRIVPVTGPVALRHVRAFLVRSERGGYAVRPLGAARGFAQAVPVAPQRSNPVPGPTLTITVRQLSRFERAGLRARITPMAAAGTG